MRLSCSIAVCREASALRTLYPQPCQSHMRQPFKRMYLSSKRQHLKHLSKMRQQFKQSLRMRPPHLSSVPSPAANMRLMRQL